MLVSKKSRITRWLKIPKPKVFTGHGFLVDTPNTLLTVDYSSRWLPDAGADSDPIKRPRASAGIAASRTPMDVLPTPISNEWKRVGQAKSLQVQHSMAALTEDDSEASEEVFSDHTRI